MKDRDAREGGDSPRPLASPPYALHEVDPAKSGIEGEVDPQARAEVMRWRKAERRRLIAERVELEAATRREFSARIAAQVESILGEVRGLLVSVYWPLRGEPDLRPLLEGIIAQGGRAALPVVAQRRHPLVFRSWAPGEPLERGVWNIPVPSGGEEVLPDVVIAPVVGFDARCYRLGYGGGYYDRTLAAMSPRPRVLGVGYRQAAIATIYPQWHDVPMDVVVTEDGAIALPEASRSE
jgi:5-formyltetrahydrofolate cyclo-ligase